ncbi:MAG: PIN domain-containing protein [Planctomycetes bacterium]|nr:PIN domain-containing protein [Planctomycetota bacterium]
MILVDAGPLIALIDRKEKGHKACKDALHELTHPMVTTWPAFSEAMYLLGDRAGWPAQSLLWRLVDRKELKLNPLNDPIVARARALMEQYADRPMDLADATLVALAEAMGEERMFTLDSDFRFYRLHGRGTFSIVPEL